MQFRQIYFDKVRFDIFKQFFQKFVTFQTKGNIILSKLHANVVYIYIYIYTDLDPDLDTTHGSRYTVYCYNVSVWIYVLNFSNSPNNVTHEKEIKLP